MSCGAGRGTLAAKGKAEGSKQAVAKVCKNRAAGAGGRMVGGRQTELRGRKGMSHVMYWSVAEDKAWCGFMV